MTEVDLEQAMTSRAGWAGVPSHGHGSLSRRLWACGLGMTKVAALGRVELEIVSWAPCRPEF